MAHSGSPELPTSSYPGALDLAGGPEAQIEINAGRPVTELEVRNTGDRPIQVGSHYHFFEVNRALHFHRDRALGLRLDIASGTAVRFEPGETKVVKLVPFSGRRVVRGHNALMGTKPDSSPGELDDETARQAALKRAVDLQFIVEGE